MQIHVGNLAYKVTEDTIKSLFQQDGEVEQVLFINHRETQRPKGFSFVTMRDANAGAKAITNINQQAFDGRALKINEDKPR